MKASKAQAYRDRLGKLRDWKAFLMKESGLPGARGNLELAEVVAEQATARQIEDFLSIPLDRAPENTARVFLVFCGVAALGKRAARGEHWQFARLRPYASDPRWRIREAVAIALQYAGDASMQRLLREVRTWRRGNWFEKRAVCAALAEPRLLKDPRVTAEVLHLFDAVTTDIERAADRRDAAFGVLRQSMGYCWSVAVAALPRLGKPLMEKWLRSNDSDVRWIMRENLKKKRLISLDTRWTAACVKRLAVVTSKRRSAA